MDRFPVLFTDRLVLRKITVEDIPSLVKHANNKNISDHILNIPYPYREPDAAFRLSYVVQGFKQKKRIVFAIVLLKEQEFTGEISLHLDQDKKAAQLAYWVAEPFWNKGIATEAIKIVNKFGFEQLGLQLIYASCKITNQASYSVLRKNGFKEAKQTGQVIHLSLTNKPSK